MTARVEASWTGLANRNDLRVQYPYGGTWYYVNVDDACDTHADLATAMKTAIDSATSGTFTVSVDSDTGKFTVSCGTAFSLTCYDPIKTFCGFSTSYSNTTSAAGSDYPAGQYRSTWTTEPDPEYEPVRVGVESNAGRILCQKVDIVPYLQTVCHFDSSTGHTWSDLKAWADYVIAGSEFALFRSSDTALYEGRTSPVNLDGRSQCKVMPKGAKDLARQLEDERNSNIGFVEFEAMVLEGY